MKSIQESFLLICLNDDFGKLVASTLAKHLDKNLVDCTDVIALDLLNSEVKKSDSNLAFLEQQEKQVIKNAVLTDNSIIYLTFDLYKRNKPILSSIKLYYVHLPKQFLGEKDCVNKMGYSYRDKQMLRDSYKNCSLNCLDASEAVVKLITGDGK